MTTLLEYIIEKHRGKPTGRGSDPGVSYWPCPVCGHDSFHTMPDKPEMKHRAKCWTLDCGFRGDALDMLKIFMPSGPPHFLDFGDRKARLAELESEWCKEQQKISLDGGRGVQKRISPKEFRQRDFMKLVDCALHEVRDIPADRRRAC